MKRIPKFKTLAEEREWWDTHSLADYIDDLAPADDVQFVRPRKEVVAIRLDKKMVDALKALARTKGIGYSPLIRMWLIERLKLEMSRRKAPARKTSSRKAAA